MLYTEKSQFREYVFVLIPLFVMVVSRIEKVNILRRDGLAKILGTIASVGGATIITLYKGPPLLHNQQSQQPLEVHSLANKTQNYTWGCIYILGHCLSWAGWMVFQVFNLITNSSLSYIINIFFSLLQVELKNLYLCVCTYNHSMLRYIC